MLWIATYTTFHFKWVQRLTSQTRSKTFPSVRISHIQDVLKHSFPPLIAFNWRCIWWFWQHLWGCSHITSDGRGGVWQMLTIAEGGWRGGLRTPYFGWRNMWTAPCVIRVIDDIRVIDIVDDIGHICLIPDHYCYCSVYFLHFQCHPSLVAPQLFLVAHLHKVAHPRVAPQLFPCRQKKDRVIHPLFQPLLYLPCLWPEKLLRLHLHTSNFPYRTICTPPLIPYRISIYTIPLHWHTSN